VLVIAGSDTTATALTTIIYFLSTNPGKLAELQKEIRSTFTSQEQIEISVLQTLPYLTAVIEEGLRIFPPTAFGLPRLSPGASFPTAYVLKFSSLTDTKFTFRKLCRSTFIWIVF
jgi:cytochrome P450